jgi:hypothetical protein
LFVCFVGNSCNILLSVNIFFSFMTMHSDILLFHMVCLRCSELPASFSSYFLSMLLVFLCLACISKWHCLFLLFQCCWIAMNATCAGRLCDSSLAGACASSPCQHGGLCSRNGNDFSCSCPATYTDSACVFFFIICGLT